MAREHPRGSGPLVGCQLRYLIGSAHGWLGGLGFAAAALQLAPRDEWIGWDAALRGAQLHRVVGLNGFLLRPAVHDFTAHIFHFGEGREIDIGQVHVSPGSVYDGKTVAASGLRDDHNVTILAIREPSGQISITPNPSTVIQPHAELIIIGPPQAIYRLERQHAKR